MKVVNLGICFRMLVYLPITVGETLGKIEPPVAKVDIKKKFTFSISKSRKFRKFDAPAIYRD